MVPRALLGPGLTLLDRLWLWGEFVDRHGDIVEDASQCALGNVAVAMDWHSGATPVWVSHDVVASADPRHVEAVTFQSLDDAVARDRKGSGASGCQCDGQLARDPELFDEAEECLTEVVQRCFLGLALAVGADARTQLGVRAPDSVLVALNNDRHGDGARLCHCTTITLWLGWSGSARDSGSVAWQGDHGLRAMRKLLRHSVIELPVTMIDRFVWCIARPTDLG
jgi:hypothetical protein